MPNPSSIHTKCQYWFTLNSRRIKQLKSPLMTPNNVRFKKAAPHFRSALEIGNIRYRAAAVVQTRIDLWIKTAALQLCRTRWTVQEPVDRGSRPNIGPPTRKLQYFSGLYCWLRQVSNVTSEVNFPTHRRLFGAVHESSPAFSRITWLWFWNGIIEMDNFCRAKFGQKPKETVNRLHDETWRRRQGGRKSSASHSPPASSGFYLLCVSGAGFEQNNGWWWRRLHREDSNAQTPVKITSLFLNLIWKQDVLLLSAATRASALKLAGSFVLELLRLCSISKNPTLAPEREPKIQWQVSSVDNGASSMKTHFSRTDAATWWQNIRKWHRF